MLALVLSAHVARADDVQQVVSTEPWGLTQRAVSLAYDVQVHDRVSLAPRIALRWPSGGDFVSHSAQTGLEARGWLSGRTASSDRAGIVGPFVYGRLDSTFTTAEAASGRSLGTAVMLAHHAGLGYRFVFARHFEITPSAGLGIAYQFDVRGRLPVWIHVMGSWAVTTGFAF
jgi:hypothetical protein